MESKRLCILALDQVPITFFTAGKQFRVGLTHSNKGNKGTTKGCMNAAVSFEVLHMAADKAFSYGEITTRSFTQRRARGFIDAQNSWSVRAAKRGMFK